jgi:hypothetical protein
MIQLALMHANSDIKRQPKLLEPHYTRIPAALSSCPHSPVILPASPFILPASPVILPASPVVLPASLVTLPTGPVILPAGSNGTRHFTYLSNDHLWSEMWILVSHYVLLIGTIYSYYILSDVHIPKSQYRKGYPS